MALPTCHPCGKTDAFLKAHFSSAEAFLVLRMTHTRRDYESVSSDDPRAWKMFMEEHHADGLQAFAAARCAIKKRAATVVRIVSKELAVAYKSGDPFPAHFVWATKSYQLDEPEVLRSATKAQRKKKCFLEGVLSAIVADAAWDRFATLVIGLTVAQKVVTHWSEMEEDET